ncbi:hypothetical protein GCM10027360_81890 [Amycolatopsis echigonensis]
MTGNYWEEAVYSVPPLNDIDRIDMSAVFDWLGRHFPKVGAKIDWTRVPGNHMHWRFDDDVQLSLTASREVCRRLRSGSSVDHVGDGLSPYGLRFNSNNPSSVVAALLEVPEHHYFVSVDRSWIVVATTEGDLDVADQINFAESV